MNYSQLIAFSGIKDNQADRKVGNFLNEKITDNSSLSIVSAYFTIYAYEALKDKLDKINNLRFLFGDIKFVGQHDPDSDVKKEFSLKENGLKLVSSLKQKTIAKDCADWIKSKVEIRSIIKSNLLHGKLYIIENQNGKDSALLGSSNFTKSGLGFSENHNIELNIIIDSDKERAGLKAWFESIWYNEGIVEDVKDKVLAYLDKLYSDYSPEFVYYKTLYHILPDQRGTIDTDDLFLDNFKFQESKIYKKLFNFQKHAVKAAINKLEQYNGCIIADSVGLGKTYEALGVIKYYELRNERVLVLCPKKLEANWTKYPAHFANKFNELADDRFHYTVLAHTDLSRTNGNANGIDLQSFNWSAFDLVVIDESHNFRNANKGKKQDDGTHRYSRYEKLMEEIIKKGVNTKVLLLSATPINNSITDLKNQFLLFTRNDDSGFYDSLELSSIDNITKVSQKIFHQWVNSKDKKKYSLFEKLPSDFFKLLDALSIARSRKHIVKYYRSELDKIGKFPDRRNLPRISTDIDTIDRFLSYKKLSSEIDNYNLFLYRPSRYVKAKFKNKYAELLDSGVAQFTQEKREHYLTGMMKVNFLKRLESSVEAFEISINRTIEKIDNLKKKFKMYRELKKKDESIDLESVFFEGVDDDDSEFDDLKELLHIGKKFKFNLAHLDIDKWAEDLNADKDQLLPLYDAAHKITPERDAKLIKLKQLIENKVKKKDDRFKNENNKKVLIFTAFSDTAKYLYENISKWAKKELKVHSAVVTGDTRECKSTLTKNIRSFSIFDYILTNFVPVAKNRDSIDGLPKNEEIDILIATDCISEGQNLQDCDYVINYDIHWNPVRIIQRFGRIDRIGSNNNEIYLQNFWPTDDLDGYINLKKRVEGRMHLVDIAGAGTENLLAPVQDKEPDETSFRVKQLLKLQDEQIPDMDDIDEGPSIQDFNLGDFRADLLNYIERNRDKLESTPTGIYAVTPSPSGIYKDQIKIDFNTQEYAESLTPGVIFCLKKKTDLKDSDVKKKNKASKELGKINVLGEYFVVYVKDNGDVLFKYTNPLALLGAFKDLTLGHSSPLEKLCLEFDNETNQGKDMDKYSELIKKAVASIKSSSTHRIGKNLLVNAAGMLPSAQNTIKGMNDFELITWLVIK